MTGSVEVTALARALAAEHAAVYAYGAGGARLPARWHDAARAGLDAHRAARDLLIALLEARDATPQPAAPAYSLSPWPATAAAGLRTLVAAERSTEAAYAALLGATVDRDVRRAAATALAAAATRATEWGLVAVPAGAVGVPVTDPLPGLRGGSADWP